MWVHSGTLWSCSHSEWSVHSHPSVITKEEPSNGSQGAEHVHSNWLTIILSGIDHSASERKLCHNSVASLNRGPLAFPSPLPPTPSVLSSPWNIAQYIGMQDCEAKKSKKPWRGLILKPQRQFFRILLKQNTALLSPFRPSFRMSVRGVTSQLFSIISWFRAETIYFLKAYHPG